ncbi:MAG: beta-propeller domain-containing protein [Myxococcales bacterium]|nr:beta-propeller domain-containing protein [Myxococcales bacterium]
MKRKHVGQRWALLFSAALLGLWLSACGGEITDPNEIPTGQKEFTTEEMGDGNSFRGGVEDGSMAPNAAGEANSNSTDASKQGAPSGRTGEVEEADLYRMSGNLLFYLNTYKGLTVFDVADPKQPKKVSNLPVFGYPIEMFVNKNIVYALVRDALYMLSVNGKFEFHRRHVSQLVTIDISNPQAPVVLQRFDIKGQLREGVSRKIEDTVYVVSYTPRWYWWGWSYEQKQKQEQVTVYSFNVANPSNIQQVQQLDLLKETSTNKNWEDNGTTHSESSNFSDITLSATSNTLLVGEQWYHYKSSYNPSRSGGSWCSRSQYENWQSMKINIVDISDPQGSIKLHTRFEYRGHMGDQFKQTYVYDETTKKGTYYGIFQRMEWKRDSNNCQSDRVVRNTLVSVDISDGKNPVVLDTLDFGKPNETVRGSLYDPERRVVYAITAVNTDPLYTMSFANPSDLKVLSAIDGLSGDMNVFRFTDSSRKYLMGIGRDTSAACTGFGSNARSTNIAVSLMDVRDLSKVRLIQRKCVAIQGAQWVNSELNWNLDQAHKMIGMYSDQSVNLITLPVNYYTRNTTNGWWYSEYKSAIGIMRWDLSKYDDTKDETQQNVLENIATMEHPKGSVKRTIIFNHQTLNRRMVLNLSDTHISMVDLGNLNSPSLISTFELAPYIRTVYRFGKYLVEQVNLGQYYDDYNEFRVKEIGTTNVNDAPVVASFKAGKVQSVIRWKDHLVLFRYYLDPNKKDSQGYPQYDYNKSEMVLYDLSNPRQPVQKGSAIIPRAFYPYYYFYCGWFDARFGFDYYWYPYYNGTRGFISTASGITTLFYQYDYASKTSYQALLMLDFSNPSSPSYKEVKLPNTNDRQYMSLVSMDNNTFYVSYREKLTTRTSNNQSFTVYRYFAERWIHGSNGWTASGNVNLPGRLSKAWVNNGKVKLLSYDQSYILRKAKSGTNTYDRYQQIFRLHLLEQSKDAKWAVLQASQSFLSWQLKDMIVDGSRLYLNATRDWYYLQENQLEWYDRSDSLMIFDLSKNTFDSKFSQATRTSNMQLSGVQNNRLFIQLPGEGLLITDVTNASAPKGLHFERTLGWAQNVELSGDYAFIASGHFGIYQVNLTKATIPPL